VKDDSGPTVTPREALPKAVRRVVHGGRPGSLATLADWSTCLYAAVLVAISGSTVPVPDGISLQSIERGELALEASPAGAASASALRQSPGEWTSSRPTGGAPPATTFPKHVPTSRDSSPLWRLAAPDLPGLSSGFQPDRSLAPPRGA
jgi:hypothetical protein